MRAAQYVRMSTDGQELSPAVQRDAIRDYAAQNGLSIVASYEDEGRSGLTLKGRPALRRLICDVAEPNRSFDVVLVYDISRWGRFQDTDASAYYEYHCRLHGVNVVYVKEPFPAEISPLNALLKGMKRAMAAEYSRELKIKSRAGQEVAIRRGFQMGKLPCIGFRRMSVTTDGTPGRVLADCERKPMQTDRVRWIAGPPQEVELVRYIFRLYTETSITIKALVELLSREGRTDSGGNAFTHQKLRSLLRCEAFAGDFVWGRREDRTGIIRREGDAGFTRAPRALEPLVARDIWDRAQQKRRLGWCRRRTPDQLIAELRGALVLNPSLALADLPGAGCATEVVYRRYFGSFTEALRLAGRVESVSVAALSAKVARRRKIGAQFRADFSALMKRHRMCLTKLPRSRTFLLPQGFSIGIQMIWKRHGRFGVVWWLGKDSTITSEYVLVVRVEESDTARDFLLLTKKAYTQHPPWFTDPSEEAIRITTAEQLVLIVSSLDRPAPFEQAAGGHRRVRYVTPLPH